MALTSYKIRGGGGGEKVQQAANRVNKGGAHFLRNREGVKDQQAANREGTHFLVNRRARELKR